MIDEAGMEGETWREVRAVAANRVWWHCFVQALCPKIQ